METSQLDELPAKLEELQRRQHVLKEALVRLQVSIAEFWCCTARSTRCAAS